MRKTVTIDEAGEILGIGRSSAYLAVKRGDLPTIRIGGRYLVSRAKLAEMLSCTSDEIVMDDDK